MFEILSLLALHYVAGCLVFAYSDAYKIDALPFCTQVFALPSWLATHLIVLCWPYVAYYISRGR